jgi:hypothetical protein
MSSGPLPRLATNNSYFAKHLGGTMKKRGRPRKNGEKFFWMLVREVVAVFAYGRARKAGLKYSSAITEATNYIPATYPLMKISETEVKRIVASWQPKQAATCLVVSKPDSQHSIIPTPRGTKIIAFTIWNRPHPVYPRANAAAKPEQEPQPRHCQTFD